MITLYLYEIIDKKQGVNSVNSQTQKNFLSPAHRLTGHIQNEQKSQ